MVNEQLDDILQSCLQRFAQGETLDVCLQQYPEHADVLLPLLQAATQVHQMPRSMRTPVATEYGRAQLRTAVQDAHRKKQRRLRHSRFITGAAAFAVLICFVFGLTTVQSASALPGDRLYNWKLTSERVRYSIAGSPAGRAQVSLWAAQRRLVEIKVLLTHGRIDHELLAALAMENARCWEQITSVQGRDQAVLVAELRRSAEAQAQQLNAAAQQTTGITQTLLALSAQKSAAADHPLQSPTPLPIPTALTPIVIPQATSSPQQAMLTPEASTSTPDASQPKQSVRPSTSQPTLVPSAVEQATSPPKYAASTSTALPTTDAAPTDEPEPPDRPATTVAATETRQPTSGASPTTTVQPTSRSSTSVATKLPVSTSTAAPTLSSTAPYPSPPTVTATGKPSPLPAHTPTPYPSPPKMTTTGAPSPTPSRTPAYPGPKK